jgi:YVTN family beta-propeller protein
VSSHSGPYAFTGLAKLSAEARRARPLVYVPNQLSGTVQIIDPRTYAVIATRAVPSSPEHVVPSPDLRRLWVNSDAGNALTPIDPRTGRLGAPVPVRDPYNLYFTPDGASALVMAERLRRIDVRDARTMALRRSLPVPCKGINHADFTKDLSKMLVSCEFSGQLVELDASATRVIRMIDLNHIPTSGATPRSAARSMRGPALMLAAGASAMPQDVRLAPDGRSFLVADMLRNGIWVIDAVTFRETHFIRTGLGAHGIYPARDARRVFVSNRDEGSVSVLSASSLRPVARWRLPGGGSPDMGGISADGRELWFSGRYNACVYVLDTVTGHLTHRIPVRAGPHGVLVWPQPGRFSLGHTGNMR